MMMIYVKVSEKNNIFLSSIHNFKKLKIKLIFIKLLSIHIETMNNKLSHYAAVGDYDMIKSLLDNEADVHANDNAAIKLSAKNGNLNIIKLLLQNITDIHAYNDALITSAQEGHNEIVKFLLENGATVYADLIMDYCNIVKLLIENGFDNVHARNDAILQWSISNMRYDIIEFLLENGATIHDSDAIKASVSNGDFDILTLLIKHGINIHIDDDYALRTAAEHGYDDIVMLMLECGANVHACDDESLRLSAKHNHYEVVKTLLQYYDKPYDKPLEIQDDIEMKKLLDTHNVPYSLIEVSNTQEISDSDVYDETYDSY